MHISNISHQFNLLLQQAKIDTVRTSKIPSGEACGPDDPIADVVCQQLSLLEKELNKDLSDLEVKISLSTIYSICNQYETISHQFFKVFQKKKQLSRISSEQLQKVVNSLQRCSQTVEKLRVSLIKKQEEIKITHVQKQNAPEEPKGFTGMLRGYFDNFRASVVKEATKLGLSAIESYDNSLDMNVWDEKLKEYKVKLYSSSKSTVAAQFSLIVGRFVASMLEEEILHVNERDPLLRGSFLKNVIYEEGVLDPKPTDIGNMLISLLENKRELLEKVVAVNLMKGFHNLYSNFSELEKSDPDFFGKFILKCIETGTEHIEKTDEANNLGVEFSVGKDERNSFLGGEVQDILKYSILNLGFPNGYSDLILPSGIPDKVREKLYGLMGDGLSKSLYSAFKDMSSNQVLKDSLVLEGFKNIQQVFDSASNTVIHSPENLFQAIVDPKKPAFATAGIVLVFFKVLFSTLGSVFKDALNFRKLFTPPKDPDPLERQINDQVYNFLERVTKASSSALARFLFKVRGRRFAEALGASLTEKLRAIKITDLLSLQLDSILTLTLAPGGHWEGVEFGRKYVIAELPKMPRTVEEANQLQQQKIEAQELLHKEVKEAKDSFAKTSSGLISMIVASLSFKPKIQVTPTSSQLYKFSASVERGIIGFANSCIEKVVKLLAYIIKADEVLPSLGKLSYKQTKKIQQDSFLIAVAKFAAFNLQAKPSRK